MTTLPASLAKVAEVTRSYANFSVPPLHVVTRASREETTLVLQSASMERFKPAVDDEPAETRWQSTLPYMGEAVRLYEAGRTVNQIAGQLGICWDSVAKLLHRAGVRTRRSRG